MNTEENLSHFLVDKIRYNLIKHYMEKNLSPQQIVEELKSVKLCDSSMKAFNINNYAIEQMSLEWSDKEKKWIYSTKLQMNMFSDLSDINKEVSDVFFENTIKNLTAKDSEVLLKDMKEILTNIKIATRNIIKITADIDRMVPYIVPRNGEKE